MNAALDDAHLLQLAVAVRARRKGAVRNLGKIIEYRNEPGLCWIHSNQLCTYTVKKRGREHEAVIREAVAIEAFNKRKWYAAAPSGASSGAFSA